MDFARRLQQKHSEDNERELKSSLSSLISALSVPGTDIEDWLTNVRDLVDRVEEHAMLAGLRGRDHVSKVPVATQAEIDQKANRSIVLRTDGEATLDGYFRMAAQDSAPDDPDDDECVIWLDGDGDLNIKINDGDEVKTTTIIDFSEV